MHNDLKATEKKKMKISIGLSASRIVATLGIQLTESTSDVATSFVELNGRENNFTRNTDPRLFLLTITSFGT